MPNLQNLGWTGRVLSKNVGIWIHSGDLVFLLYHISIPGKIIPPHIQVKPIVNVFAKVENFSQNSQTRGHLTNTVL